MCLFGWYGFEKITKIPQNVTKFVTALLLEIIHAESLQTACHRMYVLN